MNSALIHSRIRLLLSAVCLFAPSCTHSSQVKEDADMKAWANSMETYAHSEARKQLNSDPDALQRASVRDAAIRRSQQYEAKQEADHQEAAARDAEAAEHSRLTYEYQQLQKR